jgi:hypothetical protein
MVRATSLDPLKPQILEPSSPIAWQGVSKVLHVIWKKVRGRGK